MRRQMPLSLAPTIFPNTRRTNVLQERRRENGDGSTHIGHWRVLTSRINVLRLLNTGTVGGSTNAGGDIFCVLAKEIKKYRKKEDAR